MWSFSWKAAEVELPLRIFKDLEDFKVFFPFSSFSRVTSGMQSHRLYRVWHGLFRSLQDSLPRSVKIVKIFSLQDCQISLGPLKICRDNFTWVYNKKESIILTHLFCRKRNRRESDVGLSEIIVFNKSVKKLRTGCDKIKRKTTQWTKSEQQNEQ